MILSEIREYVKQAHQVTLKDMAFHFDISPDAMRGMLDIWIKKGRMHRQHANAACGTCKGCDIAAVEVYIWGGEQTPKSCDVLQSCQ